jgi:hypothetical protein
MTDRARILSKKNLPSFAINSGLVLNMLELVRIGYTKVM